MYLHVCVYIYANMYFLRVIVLEVCMIDLCTSYIPLLVSRNRIYRC